MFNVVCKVQKMLEIHFKTTSATVTVQDGEHAGQTVKVSFFLISSININKFLKRFSMSIAILCPDVKEISLITMKFMLN